MSNEGDHAYSKRKTVAKTELWLNLDMQKRLFILTMALDQSNNSIAILNRSGITIYVNPKLLSVYNTSFDKVIGKNWTSFLSLHSGLRKNIVDIRETVLKKGKVWTGEISDISHAGETIKGEITARVKGEDRYFYNIITPIVRHITGKNTKKDTVTGILGINIDITNRKQMEEKLRQSEKMEAVGQLAGGIAHDFNNQLAGIMCYADVTRDFYPDDPEFIKYIDEIKVIVRRAADLTSQLLAFARKGNNQSVPVDIHVIINDICTILSRSIDKTIRIKQHLEAIPSTILGDSSQIENALLNVAINARDAMKNGGELIFTTEIVELSEDTLPQHYNEITPGAFIKIAVIDTGCGIEEPVLSHMFEPFFTTKPAGKGTGMGLAAVYGTLQTNHGGITIQTEAGKGSTFELFFPLFNGEKNKEDKKTGTLPIKGKGHILLVEDDKAIRTSTTLNLERLGYSVVSCEDGHQAVAEYCKNPGKFDIVILDIILPGINGMTVYDSMVSCNPDVKVIFCSGYNPDERIQQLLTSMYVDFLHKPYTIKALSQKVKELILI